MSLRGATHSFILGVLYSIGQYFKDILGQKKSKNFKIFK